MNATKIMVNAIVVVMVMSFGVAKATEVVDPDMFDPGTVLNNAYPGVTLSAHGEDLVNSNVLAYASGLASTGENVFNHTGSNQPGWGNGIFEWLRVDFDMGATQVWLDFIADDSIDENATLNAYNSVGALVDQAVSVGSYSTGQVVTLMVQAPNIAYITAEGDPVYQIDDWYLDHLVYSPIPEPATICLLGLGALSLIRSSRRGREQ